MTVSPSRVPPVCATTETLAGLLASGARSRTLTTSPSRYCPLKRAAPFAFTWTRWSAKCDGAVTGNGPASVGSQDYNVINYSEGHVDRVDMGGGGNFDVTIDDNVFDVTETL